jgi:heptosyltransferase-2
VIVVRAPNWLGDTVMALPALAALRSGFPEARITVVGRWAPLLRGQGVADALLPYPRRLGERRRVAGVLRQDRADLALVLPNSLEAALVAYLWGGRRRIGFDSDGRHLLLTDAVPLPSPRLHQVDEYRLLVDRTGAASGPERPVWKIAGDRGAPAEVAALLAALGIPAAARVVGLHVGSAGGPAKQWATERFGRLADRLIEDGLTPLLLGAPEDTGAAEEARRAARSAIASAVGRDRPALLAALLVRLDCLVSGDTGVAHLAAAVGIPTVTLFGPTDARLTAPRSKAARVVDRQVPCAPCFLSRCPIDHGCMSGIEVAQVARRVREAVTR